MEILIVEDEAIIAESLFQLLRVLNYTPLEPVSTPEEAIEAINEQNPKLIILDVTLQNGRTGLEIAGYIDDNKLNIPYIILTAHSDANTISQVKKYNPDSYLVKPFSRENLFAAIEMAIPVLQGDEEHGEIVSNGEDLQDMFLKIGTKHEKIVVKDIRYIHAQGKYTKLYMGEAKRLIRMSLTATMEFFNGINWLRVHKSYSANPEYISKVGSEDIWIEGEKIPIGRFYMDEVAEFLLKNKSAG